MSSKIGTILSSLFIIIAFLLGCDLITIQYLYSDLDAKSVNISYLISREAHFDEAFKESIKEMFDVDFYCETTGIPAFGEKIKYVLSTKFDPLLIASESMAVSIERMAVVGYYG